MHKWTYLGDDTYQCANCQVIASKAEIAAANADGCAKAGSIDEDRINAEILEVKRVVGAEIAGMTEALNNMAERLAKLEEVPE